MVRRTRIAAVLTLAMINAFTIAAGLAVVHLLPPRLAALRVASVAAVPPVGAGSVLATEPGPARFPPRADCERSWPFRCPRRRLARR